MHPTRPCATSTARVHSVLARLLVRGAAPLRRPSPAPRNRPGPRRLTTASTASRYGCTKSEGTLARPQACGLAARGRFAEFERRRIVERTRAAFDADGSRGPGDGRPAALEEGVREVRIAVLRCVGIRGFGPGLLL